MNFASNYVFDETPMFVDLGISTAHTADKLKSVIAPAIRAGVFMDNSDRLTSRHRIAEVTSEKLSEAKAYSDYI